MNRPSLRIWRPATLILFGGLVLLFVAIALYVAPYFKPTTEVFLGKGFYHLWVADTEAERIQGLSGVDELQPGGGLLMKFDSDNTWGIWMKDMKFPLDIIWLDQNKQVVYMAQNVDPDLSTNVVFMPVKLARYVIELPAGEASKAGITVDVKAAFDGSLSGASQL